MGDTTAKAAPSRSGDRTDWRSFARVLLVTISSVLLILAAVLFVAIYRGAEIRGEVGWDAALYAQIGSHFLATGELYFPHQFEPYHAAHTVNLYPPTALYLFVPASFAPRILWWVVPLTIIAVSLARLRPAWWSWPIMAAACVWPLHAPDVPVALVYGNSLMWTMAAMFAAASFRSGVAWAVLMKPTHMFMALPWATRSWRGLAVMVVLSAVMLPLWFDWLVAIGNLTGAGGSIALSPALAIPAIAWAARRRGHGEARVAVGVEAVPSLTAPLASRPAGQWPLPSLMLRGDPPPPTSR